MIDKGFLRHKLATVKKVVGNRQPRQHQKAFDQPARDLRRGNARIRQRLHDSQGSTVANPAASQTTTWGSVAKRHRGESSCR